MRLRLRWQRYGDDVFFLIAVSTERRGTDGFSFDRLDGHVAMAGESLGADLAGSSDGFFETSSPVPRGRPSGFFRRSLVRSTTGSVGLTPLSQQGVRGEDCGNRGTAVVVPDCRGQSVEARKSASRGGSGAASRLCPNPAEPQQRDKQSPLVRGKKKAHHTAQARTQANTQARVYVAVVACARADICTHGARCAT